MFGPGDENVATMGASEAKALSVMCMVPTGLLKNIRNHKNYRLMNC